jgi:hypothetical protein
VPRYVILEHDHPHLHWDLMLEAGDVLRTWRLAEAPAPGRRVAAEATSDHRLIYLDYEGPVSGGRGAVTVWDRGTYELPADGPDGLVLRLSGGRLEGTARLDRHGWGWEFVVG